MKKFILLSLVVLVALLQQSHSYTEMSTNRLLAASLPPNNLTEPYKKSTSKKQVKPSFRRDKQPINPAFLFGPNLINDNDAALNSGANNWSFGQFADGDASNDTDPSAYSTTGFILPYFSLTNSTLSNGPFSGNNTSAGSGVIQINADNDGNLDAAGTGDVMLINSSGIIITNGENYEFAYDIRESGGFTSSAVRISFVLLDPLTGNIVYEIPGSVAETTEVNSLGLAKQVPAAVGSNPGDWTNFSTVFAASVPTATYNLGFTFDTYVNNSDVVTDIQLDRIHLAVDDTIDSDNDNVPDKTDLDDDNDGILDTNECLEALSPNVYNSIPGSFPISNGTVSITNSAGNFSELQQDGFDIVQWNVNSNTFESVSIDFFESDGVTPKSITNFNTTIFDVDNQTFNPNATEEMKIEAFIGGVAYTISASELILGSTITYDPITDVYTGSIDSFPTSTADEQAIKLNISGPIDRVVISARETYFGIGRNFAFSNPSFCPAIDTNNDNSPNTLDLDSDGDGCSDAAEAGVPQAQGVTGNDFKFTTLAGTASDANSDGLADAVDANLDGIPDYTSTYNLVIDGINSGACAMPTDTDNDGVPDEVDLDDDNDGILDSIEQTSCGSLLSNFEFETPAFTNVNGNNFPAGSGVFPGNYELGGWTTDNTITGNNGFNVIRVDGAGYLNPPSRNLGPNLAHTGSQYVDILDAFAPVEQTFTVTQTGVYGFGSYFASRDSFRTDFTAWTGTVQILDASGTTEIAVSSGVDFESNLPVQTHDPELWYEVLGTVSLTAGTIYTWRANVGNFGHVDTGILRFGSFYCDTDNDGIPDYQDLDSDNDGIYDVVEAGGTDANNDGRADDDDDNANNNASNGLPTSVGTGLMPTETTTGTPDYLNLDSDGDRCSDANEAYISSTADGSDSGVYGADPATVNANGLVAGASYTTGNIANVTVIGPDADSDGIADACDLEFNDNDGDGIADAVDLDDDNDGILDTIEAPCTDLEPLAGSTNNIAIWEHPGGNFPQFFEGQVPNAKYISKAGIEIKGSGLTILPVSDIDSGIGSLTIRGVDQPDLASAKVDNDFMEYSFITGGDSWRISRLFAFDTPTEVFNGGGAIFNGYDITIEISKDNFATSLQIFQDTDNPQDMNPGHGGENYFQILSGANQALLEANSQWKVRVYFYANPASNNGQATWDNFTIAGRLCSDDIDMDGIPNDKDTDSDNDGCADAVEAAGAFTTTSLDGDNSLGDTVGATGIPSVAGAGQANSADVATVGPDADLDGISDACDDIFNDNDLDGIPDFTDLDDDNDGILDTVEDPCIISATADSNIANWTHDNVPDDDFFRPTLNQAAFLNTGVTSTENVGSGLIKSPLLSVNSISDFLTVRGADATTLADAIAANDYIEYSFQSSSSWTLTTIFILRDIVSASSGLVTSADVFTDYDLSVQISNDNFATSTELMNTVTTPPNTTFFTGGTDGSNVFSAIALDKAPVREGPFYKIRVYIFGNNLNANPDASASLDNFSIGGRPCEPFLDIDNDGIPNSKDIDSDNDGCPDAIEAAGTFTTTSLDGDNSLSGAVGLTGIPTVAGTGQNTTTDVTTEGPDSDGDGIADACDLAFDDNDGDGIADIDDLDDDNDGITDVDENYGSCTPRLVSKVYASATGATYPSLTYELPKSINAPLVIVAVTSEREHAPQPYSDNFVSADALSAATLSLGGVNGVPLSALTGNAGATGIVKSNDVPFQITTVLLSSITHYYVFDTTLLPVGANTFDFSAFNTPKSVGDETTIHVFTFDNVSGIEEAGSGSEIDDLGATDFEVDYSATFAAGQPATSNGTQETDNLLFIFANSSSSNGGITADAGWNTERSDVLSNNNGEYIGDPNRTTDPFDENNGISSLVATRTNITGVQNNTFNRPDDQAMGSHYIVLRLAGICPQDTDMDGTPDYLDTDSDNDGCADAIEAAGALMVSDLDTDNSLKGNVDNNPASASYGIPIAAGTGQATTPDLTVFGPDMDSDGIADACDMTDDRPDSDMDGIPDSIDLDDDNDGILDSIECGDPANMTSTAVPTEFILTSGGKTANITAATNANGTINNNNGNDFMVYTEDIPTGTVATYTLTSDMPLTSVQLNFSGVGSIEGRDAALLGDFTVVYLDGTTASNLNFNSLSGTIAPFNTDVETPLTKGVLNGLIGVSDATNANADGTTGNGSGGDSQAYGTIDFTNVLTQPITAISFSAIGRGGGSALVGINATIFKDSDGDGISDCLDTDSDGDGCADAIEAAGTFTTADIIANGSLTNDPVAVDTDPTSASYGVPTIAGTGQATTVDVTTMGPDEDFDGISDACDPVDDRPDSDMDGIKDFEDLDDDNDGIPDVVEVYGGDSDNDGIPDYEDPDFCVVNFQGINGWDCATMGLPDPEGDLDGDGIPNSKDSDFPTCGSLTNGICSSMDNDGDGIPNHFDLDSDNDGIPDVVEVGGVDTDGDGKLDDTTDTDGDGLVDSVDNDDTDGPTGTNPCAAQPNCLSINSTSILLDSNGDGNSDVVVDKDNDGIPDSQDLDSDNDGIPDVVEAGGTDVNGDGKADNFVDTDGDGFNDVVDGDVGNDGTSENIANALVPTGTDTDGDGNPNSYPKGDTDGDGVPDFLDLDADNDGIPDVVEVGGTDVNGDGRADDFVDADNDGFNDVLDGDPTNALPIGTDTPGANSGNALLKTGGDTDNDGKPDSYPEGDNDGDGILNHLDLDADNDGVFDVIEVGGTDADQDGIEDNYVDADGDGFNDTVDGDPTNVLTIGIDTAGSNSPNTLIKTGIDADGDGKPNSYPEDDPDTDDVPNFLDLDSDDDGCSDANEAYNGRFIDGRDDGVFGIGTPTVGGTGLVTGAAYDTGAVVALLDGGPGSICNPDTDMDGVIDRIDLDDDNDGILDVAESQGNDIDGDEDDDGIPNWQDTTDDGNGSDNSTTDYTDSNGDGIPDVYDFDGDGIPNHLDLDADNDGIYDVIESGGLDANDDGRADDDDNNADNTTTNGIPTSSGAGIMNPRDTGNNNSSDYLNTDSDGDGCSDTLEAGFADDNNDGQLGDIPIIVDDNGVVTSGTGYLAPIETNVGTADYVDKAVNPCANISITKTATLVDTNGSGRDDVGDTINYAFVVTNTGTVDLNGIKVTDFLATVTPATEIDLAAGAIDNSTYTASYIIKQVDLNSGSFINTASASGKDPGGSPVTDDSDDPTNPTDDDPNGDGNPDDPTVQDFTQEPSISLLKTGVLEDDNADGFPNAGEKIRYSFTVENTGNVTLTGVTVNDPLVVVSGGPLDLDPGVVNTNTFFALYTLTQADIDNGSITNAAVATGKDPNNANITDNSDDPTNNANVDDNADGDPDDDTVIPLLKNAKIVVFKTGAFVDTNSDGAGQIGETIGYIFDVRNVGNVTLTGITINDPKVTVNGGPITLAPDASDNTTFSASYPLTLADINAAEVINTATVISKDPDNLDVTDTSDDPTTVDPEDATIVKIETNPELFLFKTAVFNDENGDTFADAGETITYSFDVRNTGNVTITDIAITDPLITVSGGPIDLDPAQFDDTTFTGNYIIKQEDVEAGTIENQAIVTGTDNIGGPVMGVSDFSDDPNNPVNIDRNNDGDPDDPTVTDLPSNPEISLEKVGTFNDENNDGLAQVGETMTYTFKVENTGNITLTDVNIADPIVAVSGGPIVSMLPGVMDTGTFKATYSITQSDIDAGEVSNLATISGKDGNNMIVTDDSDDPNEPLDTDNNNDGEPDDPTILVTPQKSSIALTKEATPISFANVGDVITYDLVVTNTGNTTLTNVVVTDNNAIITSGSPIATLAPGVTANVVATYTITQNDMNAESFTNVAMVTSRDPEDDVVADISDDPNNTDDVDDNADGDPDDPTIVRLDSDGDGIPNDVDLDDDNDGITDVEEQNGFDFLDTDNDGIVDRLDIDADGDGINDIDEAGHGIADPDGNGRIDGPVGTDGIPDIVQNDPNGGTVTYTPKDTDGDGKDDFQDIDDDGDGVPTKKEVIDGTDPLEECDLVFTNIVMPPEASWNALDCDGDGVRNDKEIMDGTDPTNACDFIETSITEPFGANFILADCDGDGVTNEQEKLDGTNAEDPCDFVLANASVIPSARWNTADCDGDGVPNGQELTDGTGPKDLCDFTLANASLTPDAEWNAADCDGDLITNERELQDSTNPKDDCDHINGTPLGTSDCDNDGLTNSEEVDLGTDPNDDDTDGDGIPDGKEFTDNTNPLDPCESIGGTPPAGSACGLEISNNLMTPDGDNVNDFFKIKNIEQFPNNTVEIFNRWGVKVFSAKGYDNETNTFIGISNGRVVVNESESLPAGVYFYVINYDDNGVSKAKSGYLYINQ